MNLSATQLINCIQTFEMGSEMLSVVCPKRSFADSVVKSGSLWRLFRVLERREIFEDHSDSASGEEVDVASKRKAKGWDFLESLSSSPSVAGKLFSSSCWLELLGVLAGYGSFTQLWSARLGAAKTLSRLLWDPSVGPAGGTYRRNAA